jgi:hypothetical protein
VEEYAKQETSMKVGGKQSAKAVLVTGFHSGFLLG